MGSVPPRAKPAPGSARNCSGARRWPWYPAPRSAMTGGSVSATPCPIASSTPRSTGSFALSRASATESGRETFGAAAFSELRRRLATVPGVVPATADPPASHGRADEARIVPAELIEPPPLRAQAAGSPSSWPGPVAFLDGTQRHEVVAYAGPMPLVAAEVAAAVRERVGRQARTVH